MENKLKKSINISIQSKKYFNKINSILGEWNEEGLTPSNVICENILLGHTISKSASLIKIAKLLEMIEGILAIKYKKDSIEYQLALEEILSSAINIDMSKINSLLISEIQTKPKLIDNIEDISSKSNIKPLEVENKIIDFKDTTKEEIKNQGFKEEDDFLNDMFFNS